jgi:hypothetical protein
MDKKLIVAGLALVAVTFSAGRFSAPAKVETKEVQKVVYVDRIVKEVDKDVQTTTKETTLPNGTKIKETVKEDKSKIHTDENKSGTSVTVTETKVTTRPDWRLGLYYRPAMRELSPCYGAIVERRLLGEVFVGAIIGTDKTAAITITLGF